MNRRTLAQLLATIVAGRIAADVAAEQRDELAERRRQRAMALHPAGVDRLPDNVIPLRTPDEAS